MYMYYEYTYTGMYVHVIRIYVYTKSYKLYIHIDIPLLGQRIDVSKLCSFPCMFMNPNVYVNYYYLVPLKIHFCLLC